MHRFENMGRGDVAHVEWRILAHQHHIRILQKDLFGLAHRRVIAGLAPQRHRPHPRIGASVAHGECMRFVIKKPVAAVLRLDAERECRIRVDIDVVDGVHLDGDGKLFGAHAGGVLRGG